MTKRTAHGPPFRSVVDNAMTQQAVFIQLTLTKWTCTSRWGPAELLQWAVFIDVLLARPYMGPHVTEADQSSALGTVLVL